MLGRDNHIKQHATLRLLGYHNRLVLEHAKSKHKFFMNLGCSGDSGSG